jgi:hypothetical protein
MMRLMVCLAVFVSCLLWVCGHEYGMLTAGKTTLAELLEKMGQPSMVWSDGDGALQMEFSQRGGSQHNFMARVSPRGILVSLQEVLTVENVDALQTGMTQEQVRRHLGQPERVEKSEQGDVWHWRMGASRTGEWQIDAHFGARGILKEVQRTHTAPMPSANSSWRAVQVRSV